MILVVDDHRDTCDMLSRLLRACGYQTTCLTEPAEVLPTLGSAKYDCVILDDHMPGITGLELLRAIRQDVRFAKLPVFVYSAAQESDRQAEAKSLGAAAWIVKGTPFDIVLDRIAQMAK